ncbi:MAG TPA: 4-hydroxy-tetrahydrodipicolinate synthase [Candidatus Spyradosoma merdigallinarum]|uniref:4-hydroxy-tetrahydrodipicolinate synthase n=1 Tax=Candidatus Spyradosoma merdigallinarum TaxID=2840950 RepID=A0A9D1NK99_9BACT|nr:4-hydroxy-tetrahydrodipicolinate synthase [Candidatus Spyradosoma merdigallinarum]
MSILNPSVYSGAWTALVTPMRNGAVDYSDLKKLVDFQVAGGIDGILSVGTSGESPTLTHEEHLEVIAKTIEFAAGRVPVLAGTGANSTHEAVLLTREAEKLGAQAFLHVAPYYNKPGQEGVYRHFAEIASATDKPIMLYSIPGRCGIEISVETIVRLRKAFPNVIGVKEAGGSCDKVSRLVRELDPDFLVMSGDDSLTLPFMSLGARGVISVASNLFPRQVAEMTAEMRAGNLAAALKIHNAMADLFKKFFIEPNPVPVKFALARAGVIGSPEVRLPLVEMSAENCAVVAAALDAFAGK